MAWVYVLESLKSRMSYAGSTSRDPSERLAEHNAGIVPWTRAHRPLEIVYAEEIESMVMAQKRERFFKTGKGRQTLKTLLKDKK